MNAKRIIVTDYPNFDEELFRLLVASVREYAIFMIDPQGYILTWNEGAARIKGYHGKDIIGKHISIFYTPEDILNNEPQYILNQALNNGTYEGEGWRVRRDGTRLWASVVITPLFHNGKHIGFAKVTRDQSERKVLEDQRIAMHRELERKVREQTGRILANELRFRKLIEHSSDGITLLDRNFRVFYRSLSASRIIGWSDEERIDAGMDEFVHPDDLEQVHTSFNRITKNPAIPVMINFRSRHRGGHYIWLECLFTNMLADPHINAVVCNFRDITSRVESENEILRQNAVLREVSWISSHEIRRPVASMLGLLNLIELSQKPAEKKKLIKMVSKCAEELDGIIHLISDKINENSLKL
ncbi:MAG TPA: PAS domain S-box protein [Mucilaginibacter sp.]|nr:PAS domain S-box protein [Mucilaginibacter sp.]